MGDLFIIACCRNEEGSQFSSVHYYCLYVYNFFIYYSQQRLDEASSSYTQNYTNSYKQQVTIKGNIH